MKKRPSILTTSRLPPGYREPPTRPAAPGDRRHPASAHPSVADRPAREKRTAPDDTVAPNLRQVFIWCCVPWLAGVSPGPGGRAVAVQDFASVLVPRGGGPVGVQDDGPALLVNHDLVVEAAEQRAVLHAGLAAVGLVGQVVHLTACGRLVAAAGEPAVLVPQDDGAADRGRDVAADPHVQRQARPAQPHAQLPAPQEARQPARARYQVDRLANDRLLEGFPGARVIRAGRGRAAAVVAGGAIAAVAGSGGAAGGGVVAELAELHAQPDQVLQGGRV